MHKPVLLETVLSYLELKPGHVALDATIGSGGHAEAILKAIGSQGRLIGLDQDVLALERVRNHLVGFEKQVILKHLNFRYLDQVLFELNFKQVHAVLLDVGVSSEQLEDPERGFSFQLDGPLDMRMDSTGSRKAEDIIAQVSLYELTTIFRKFGEERYARRIAEAIVNARTRAPIQTTGALKALIERAVPIYYLRGRIHPATRVFQALRIVVNDELGALEEALPKAFDFLEPGGRLAVISFHSLEDRIVKRFFVKQKQSGLGKVITKKPIVATSEEIGENPRSRSAKLRVIERS